MVQRKCGDVSQLGRMDECNCCSLSRSRNRTSRTMQIALVVQIVLAMLESEAMTSELETLSAKKDRSQ